MIPVWNGGAHMKYFRLLLVFQLLLLGLGAIAATASGQVQDGPEPNLSAYHLAASDAEKTLDRVLRSSEKDANLLDFVLHTPWYKPRADKGYVGYFTKHFLSVMAEMEKKAVKDNCKGKYLKGEICGLDYNPLTCAQDQAETRYLYRADSSDDAKAVISYVWPGEAQRAAVFEMLYENGCWKIDAVRCRPDDGPPN